MLKNITLKSHEPDKNLTYIQRCLERYICNLSQQQILLFNKLHFQNTLSHISHKSPALQNKSASCLLLIVVDVILCFCRGPCGEQLRSQICFLSCFLVPCPVFCLNCNSKVSVLGAFYWFQFSQWGPLLEPYLDLGKRVFNDIKINEIILICRGQG